MPITSIGQPGRADFAAAADAACAAGAIDADAGALRRWGPAAARDADACTMRHLLLQLTWHCLWPGAPRTAQAALAAGVQPHALDARRTHWTR